MLLKLNLYDLFVLSFVQLVVSTVLVLSPAREIGSRFRWTGSRITEVVVGSVGAIAITAIAVELTHLTWGLQIGGLETAAYPLALVSIVVIALQPDRNVVGCVFYASFGSASLAFIVWAAYIAVIATTSILETVTASLVLVLDLAAFLVWMSNINYQSDVLARSGLGRPPPKADPSYQPFVSLHIPAYNEPPELLIQTIQAAEAIDYPNFEVVVVDNNTKDPAVWRPVEDYCRDRPRVKFVHVAPWPGYKAGACNLVLRRYTDPRAEVIGLVDADDLVQPYYLREVAPYFSDPDLGFVQTFEGNREFEGSPYYTACVDSFQAFYLSVMSSRNERNTVPFVGTMGLFRRSALTAIGGWNEWCICEDTEASLRVTKAGWSGLYIPRCFGRGVVPPSFAGMLTQRHRWCFGAMQILRLHWRSLMPWDRSPDNHLTSPQRRDYLMASVGWFRDLLMLAFSLLLLAITGLLASGSGFAIAPLDGKLSLLPMSLIIIATVCMMFTQRHWTTLSFRRAVLSLVISLAVTWVIARGCIEGAARRDGVFLRTSKSGGRRTILTALKLTRWETGLAVALYLCVGLLADLRHKPWLLIFLVFVQATVYLCAPITAVWNFRAQGARSQARQRGYAERRLRAARRRRTRSLVPRPAAAAVTALCIGGVASAFVAPCGAAARHRYHPGLPAVAARLGQHRGLPQGGLVQHGGGQHVLPHQLDAPGRCGGSLGTRGTAGRTQLPDVFTGAARRNPRRGRGRPARLRQPRVPEAGCGRRRPAGDRAGRYLRHRLSRVLVRAALRYAHGQRLASASRGQRRDHLAGHAAGHRPVRRAARGATAAAQVTLTGTAGGAPSYRRDGVSVSLRRRRVPPSASASPQRPCRCSTGSSTPEGAAARHPGAHPLGAGRSRWWSAVAHSSRGLSVQAFAENRLGSPSRAPPRSLFR